MPVLLRRYMETTHDYADVLGKPVPTHGRGNAERDGGLEGFVAIAASRPGCQGVMCFFDSDKDCAAKMGPAWLLRATEACGVPVFVVLAEPNFEQWIYSSAETLSLGLDYTEGANGMGAIVKALKPVKYVKPTWQPRLTHRMDLQLAAERHSGLQRTLRKFDELRAGLDLK
ncbi:hypothetical protein [Nocardioides marmoraquaticus]